MQAAVRQEILEKLRADIARIELGSPATRCVLPFALDELDRRLPDGGLALGALHEISAATGAAHETAAALFAAGILARLTGSVLWCLRSHDLFAPGLSQVGLHPDRVIYA